MSDSRTVADADGPADLVEVPVRPPREPAAYRATTHFQQSLRDRVPELDRSVLPRRVIQNGTATRQVTDDDALDLSEGGTPIAFTETVAGGPWTVVVALRPEAFADHTGDRLHRALTIYQGRPSPEAGGGDA